MKDIMSINILGQPYKLIFETEKENPKLGCGDGYCDWTSKTIVVDKSILERAYKRKSLDNIDSYFAKVIRHEIIHAFLFESGLERASHNEQCVDWFAMQWDKVNDVFNSIFEKETE